MVKVLVSLLLLAFVPLSLVAEPAIDALQEDLLHLAKDNALQSAHLGIAVASTKYPGLLFRYNEMKRFVPASNMKLFTTAAALIALSPDFTYETTLSTDGKVHAGALEGNLIITASGDPTISALFNGNNPTSVFEEWGDALLGKGIKRVHGDVVVDNSAFRDNPLGEGWQWDDADHCFSAPKDAFSFNNNCLAIAISPGGTAGTPATFRLEPITRYFSILNKVTTGASGTAIQIDAAYAKDSRNIVLSGVIPLGQREYTRYLSVRNPAEFGVYIFKEVLRAKGISVDGKQQCRERGCAKPKNPMAPKASKGPGVPNVLAVYRSPKLSEIIKIINKISSNFYTEQLFLTIPKTKGWEGNAREASLAVQEILKGAGINLDGFTMVDGSGLSRLNLVTPEQTVELLRTTAQGPSFAAFYDSLAIAGEDGTLTKWSKGARPEYGLRAKTGTMTHVRNLSGYVTTRDGELLAFSFFCNNYDMPRTALDGLYEQILARLARFSRE